MRLYKFKESLENIVIIVNGAVKRSRNRLKKVPLSAFITINGL